MRKGQQIHYIKATKHKTSIEITMWKLMFWINLHINYYLLFRKCCIMCMVMYLCAYWLVLLVLVFLSGKRRGWYCTHAATLIQCVHLYAYTIYINIVLMGGWRHDGWWQQNVRMSRHDTVCLPSTESFTLINQY